jgi:hypothetical protein
MRSIGLRLSRSGIGQEVGLHHAFAFDFHCSARLELESIPERNAGGSGHLNSTGKRVGFHAARSIPPTDAARAPVSLPTRAGDVTPTVAGAFRLSNGGAFAVRLVDVPPLEGGGVARQTYL